MGDSVVRVGCAAGFWGDSQLAAAQLVGHGQLDYLVSDYLAEITMALLARAASASADAGYATDFVTAVAPLLPELLEQGVRVVTNAGGVNPLACRDAVLRAAAKRGLTPRVAVVAGDDLLDRAEELLPQCPHLSGAPVPAPEQLLSMNAYLGAWPIAAALAQGADVVITGRCVDSALVLGPLLHEFSWPRDDFQRLASGSLAGHIIECGAQATGGIFTDWESIRGWADIGYPIVECAPDGSCVVTKAPGTGGQVTPATVAEQIVYEIGDPGAYALPDVICDFRDIQLVQTGPDRVQVSGARGRAPSGQYKVSATYYDGYRTTAVAMLCGIAAARKASRVAEALLERARGMLRERGLEDFRAVDVEVIGAEATYGPHARVRDPREVMLKIAVHHDKRRALSAFIKEIASAGTSFAPGLTGLVGGRPRPAPMIRLVSLLVDKAAVPVSLIDGDQVAALDGLGGDEGPAATAVRRAPSAPEPDPAHVPSEAPPACIDVPLVDLALGRSGDKGDDVTIGIIAREQAFVPVLRRVLTTRAVADYFAHILEGGAAGEVERFEWPGLMAWSFVLHRALGGGGLSSLRLDAQGKALAQMLLDFPVSVPAEWPKPFGILAGRSSREV